MVGKWSVNIEHWQGKTKQFVERTDPVPFCPTLISHGLARGRTQVSAGRARLIFWALVWAASRLFMTLHTRVQSQGHVGSVVNKRAPEQFLPRADWFSPVNLPPMLHTATSQGESTAGHITQRRSPSTNYIHGAVVEKIAVALLLYQSPAIYGTRSFNPVFTKSRHLFLFRTR